MEITNNTQIIKIVDIVSKQESINRIGVFGSYARGESSEISDMDLLYDYNDSNIDDTIKCLAEIQRHLNTDVDFIAYEDLFEVNNEYDVKLKENVLKDVIWIYTADKSA